MGSHEVAPPTHTPIYRMGVSQEVVVKWVQTQVHDSDSFRVGILGQVA